MVQNLAPGATGRLGLSYQDLRKSNPGIIVCDISGYGADGPYRDKKAYDLLVQSEAGLLSVTGSPEEPAKAGISIADIAAGMYAYSNILGALLERGKSREGRNIDISMLESMAEWMGFSMYYAHDGQSGPTRAGASHATIYPYGPFETGDGESVMLGIQNEREWIILCRDVLGDASLATDHRFSTNSLRSQNRNALKIIICGCFARIGGASIVLEKLDSAGIANAKVNDMEGLWNHPQLQARRRWTTVQTPAGEVAALLPPGVRDSAGVRIESVPFTGEHNESIMAEFGLLDGCK